MASGVAGPAAAASADELQIRGPTDLYAAFDAREVGRWDENRFRLVKQLNTAARNQGQVFLMCDTHCDALIAVKKMPNEWIQRSHTDFVREHPAETEQPWQDIGCMRFLRSVGFTLTSTLLGVYRDAEFTYVTSSFCSEGDLFDWCQGGIEPCAERERAVRTLAMDILSGFTQLHNMQIAHRDISLENILLDRAEEGTPPLEGATRIIDFGMATIRRTSLRGVRGKMAYQAPEMHIDQDYDVFLADVFSIGVALYAMTVRDYPWLSTRPGGCKCFQYVQQHGFRAFLEKRKLRNSPAKVAEVMSEPLKQLLEGMLTMDPAKRLTLGEKHWAELDSSRRSVWDEPWLQLTSDESA